MDSHSENLGELVQVTAYITLSPPQSLEEMSPAGAFKAALYAVIIKLCSLFPRWLGEIGVEELYKTICLTQH